MTKTQEQIAEAAARKMLEQHYLTVGYDITDPDDVLRLQADMLHLRTVRDITSKMGMRAVLTATAIIVTAVLLFIAQKTGLTSFLDGAR